MNVLDPGHLYLLDSLDGDFHQELRFVKREGARYPGNVGHYPGTTMQEVIRALIERMGYVNNQIPCNETAVAREHMVHALRLLELRAARCRGRTMNATDAELIYGSGKCLQCGHVGCEGHEA